MAENNGEFKGSVKESIADLKDDVKDLRNEVANLRRWLTILSVMLTVAVIERIPDFIKVISAVASGG